MKEKILTSAKKGLLFLPHAIKQMSRPDRMITTENVRSAILQGEVIEEYFDDQRGESCLVFHFQNHRAIHVVCAPKADYLAIITAYIPAPDQWATDFKTRR
jgi:hypothetical protein